MAHLSVLSPGAWAKPRPVGGITVSFGPSNSHQGSIHKTESSLQFFVKVNSWPLSTAKTFVDVQEPFKLLND